MSNEQNADFIASETSRMQKSTRNTWMVGIGVLVVLSIYFSFILSMVKTFLEPEVAAYMVAKNVKSSFPTYMDQAEMMLAAQSVVMAEELSDSILEVFPGLRLQAEMHLDRTHQEIIPHMSREFQGIIADYIRANQDKIELAVSSSQSEEFTQTFVNDVLDQFGVLLNEHMEKNLNGRDLEHIQLSSLMALETMNDYLDLLIETEPEHMTRSMELHKELLAAITKRGITGIQD